MIWRLSDRLKRRLSGQALFYFRFYRVLFALLIPKK